jgi:hypothetical protein
VRTCRCSIMSRSPVCLLLQRSSKPHSASRASVDA